MIMSDIVISKDTLQRIGIISAIVLGIAGLIWFIVYWTVINGVASWTPVDGKIVGVTYHEAYSEMQSYFDPATETTQIRTIHHPARWEARIEVRVDYKDHYRTITYGRKVNDGEMVKMRYGYRKKSGDLVITTARR